MCTNQVVRTEQHIDFLTNLIWSTKGPTDTLKSTSIPESEEIPIINASTSGLVLTLIFTNVKSILTHDTQRSN